MFYLIQMNMGVFFSTSNIALIIYAFMNFKFDFG